MKSNTRKKILLLQLLFISSTLLCSVSVYAQPIANFTCSNVSGCAPILVNFTDQSTGNPTQWKWDLGNGTVSYLQNPSVTYFNPGTYTVKLVVQSGTMVDSVVKLNQITVYGPPVIDFGVTQTAGCNQVNASFTDKTISTNGTLTEWKWDFGDGRLSDERNPQHLYDQAGDFNVTLNVKNSYGCSASLLKTAYVKVTKLKADFQNVSLVRCSPTMIKFSNKSVASGTTRYKWYWGNGDSSVFYEQYYTYANGGTYTVKLIATSQAGCIDSISKTIKVDTPVRAYFTAIDTTGCKPPFTAQFIHQPLTGNTYSWNFGDNNKSTVFQPYHDYIDSGKYSVKLIVRNTNGCVDSFARTNYIRVKAATIQPLNLPDSICIGTTKKIDAEVNPGDSLLSVLWKFDDGATSKLLSPSHAFTTEGYHTISAITVAANGCVDTLVYKNAIKTSERPAANFKVDLNNTCAYTKLNFTNLTTGTVTKWNWEFNNSDVSYDKDPIYTFRDSGYVPVQLVAKNGGCSDTSRKENFIYLKPSVSKFKYNYNCDEPGKITFNNNSLGADKVLWSFGDGTTYAEVNPVHSYRSPGSYSVALETWNNTTGCYYLQTLPLKIAKHAISFYASDTMTCKRNELVFNAEYDTAVSKQMVWDFGDGIKEVSKQGVIKHIYREPGNYTVSLVTINEGNCNDTLVKKSYIRVNGPSAYLSVGVQAECFKRNILFKDSSQTDGLNAIQKWDWNYGDGIKETLLNAPFNKVYSKQGTYTVTLKVTDASGCTDSTKLPWQIKIVQPSAAFNIDTIGCTYKAVLMGAPYADANIKYQWDLGDGKSDSTQYVKHIYNLDGYKSVKLIVTNTLYGCADTVSKSNVVRIEDPIASFTMSDSFKTCPPLLIEFSNQSTNVFDELWNFGDGSATANHVPSHFYSYPGVYTATLTVKSKAGCSSQMQKQIIVKGPKGTLTFDPFNICKQQQVNFRVKSTDAVSYTWDFNDGATLNNTDTIVSHKYTNSGGYLPKIMLMDDKGCKVPVTGKDSVQIRLPFKMSVDKPAKVCTGLSQKLKATGAAIYQWSPATGLDNPVISSPVASPTEATVYKVIGKDNKGCYADTGFVSLELASLPSVNAGTDQTVESGTPLDLVPTVSNDVTEVRWSPTGAIFRNSGSGITVKPQSTTEYTVEVKNNNGCTASDKVNIVVTKPATTVNGFFVPNTFSPNGDGVNDKFYPRSGITMQINSIKIFNRFGAVVFERSTFNTNDANAGWDGTSRGTKLLNDVYLYVISITDTNNKTKLIEGDVALIR